MPRRPLKRRGSKDLTRELLQELTYGPGEAYVPPVLPFRQRRPDDKGELELTKKAKEERRKYWEKVTYLEKVFKRLSAADKKKVPAFAFVRKLERT